MRSNILQIECPFCHQPDSHVKAGLRDGVQRYRCNFCYRRFSPEPKHRGIAAEIRQQALDLHSTGISARETGRRLGLKPRSIANWVNAADGVRTGKVLKPTEPYSESETPSKRRVDGRDGNVRRRATIHDVAGLAGVSPSTVSNYLNGKGRMRESTRMAIQSAATQLHFAPNSLVKAIRERKTKILGVVTFGLNDLGDYRRDSIVAEVLGGINREAGACGYNVLLYTALLDDMRASAGTMFLDGKIDGLMWVGPDNREQRHSSAAQAGLPVMSLLARQDIEGVGYVDIDNVNAIRQVVQHLVHEGHRRIAYAGPTINQTFLDRLHGYRVGLDAEGIRWDRGLVAANKAITRCWISSGRTDEYEATIDRWLAMEDPPTAIIFTTDEWGSWATGYLENRGIRVPDDICVTGFDDTARRLDPTTALTSVAQDFPEIGRLGAQCVINMINGASYEDCRLLLPGKLIVRKSSTTSLI